MWCVPTAVAALTGGRWSREKVWLDILAQRVERGRRLTNIPGRIDEPHGGAHAAEAIRTLAMAGYECVECWPGTKRWTIEQFWRYVDGEPGGRFLVLQRMHLAHHIDGLGGLPFDESLIPGLPVAKAWRVIKRPIGRGRRGGYGATVENAHRAEVASALCKDQGLGAGDVSVRHRDQG